MRSTIQDKAHDGVGRKSSEDVCRVDESLGLYLVCDGSRDEDGRWAAETICDVVQREMRKEAAALKAYRAAPSRQARTAIEATLRQAIRAACSEIHRICCVDRTKKRSSSALGAVLFLGDYAISVHVGNTRLYLVRAGKALRLTRDHTYYEEMVRELPPGTPINPIFKKRLTHAIGDSESVPLALNSVPLQPGDLMVLCSNGLSDHLKPESTELAALCAEGDPTAICARLVSWAVNQGSEDNITVLVARIEEEKEETTEREISVARDPRKQVELLKSIRVFSAISQDTRALMKLQSLLTFRHARPGDLIVQQGGPSDEMFVLISGKTEVRVDDQVIAHRGAGDVIGEMGFFDRRLRSATIRAVEATELASIQRWEFDALVQQDWRLGYKILEAVVAAVSEKLQESSDGFAKTRTLLRPPR